MLEEHELAKIFFLLPKFQIISNYLKVPNPFPTLSREHMYVMMSTGGAAQRRSALWFAVTTPWIMTQIN